VTIPAYQRVLGDNWNRLPGITRQLHSPNPEVVFRGHADIRRTANPLANLAADIMGLPKAGQAVPATITVNATADGEILSRDYGGTVFQTRQSVDLHREEPALIETVGPFRLTFRLHGSEAGIDFELAAACLWGVPLPLWLAPRMRATERADGDVHIFDVASALPLIGELVSYKGRLRHIA
jgi:hypothetical protein